VLGAKFDARSTTISQLARERPDLRRRQGHEPLRPAESAVHRLYPHFPIRAKRFVAALP
jgi:hypothetical protein